MNLPVQFPPNPEVQNPKFREFISICAHLCPSGAKFSRFFWLSGIRISDLSLVILCLLIGGRTLAETAAPNAAEDVRVTTAKKILADYQAGEPRNHRVLHVAYFCPADRTPAPDYQARLGRVLDDISGFYAAQLRQYGLPSDGIPLARGTNGSLIIHLVKGSRPAAEYSEAKSADEIRRDVRQVLAAEGIGLRTNHVVVFTRLGNYDGTNTSHNSPYCGMGDCHSGFCWQFDSELLDPRQLENANQWVQDHQYGHINLGRYNSIFIGGAAHELGHLFGLPHNAEAPGELLARGHALMGDGNRHFREELRKDGPGSFLTLAHALRLVSNPVFSQVDKGLAESWHGTVTDCRFDAPASGYLKITGQYKSNQPIYGVVAYVDPDGGSDYDAVSYAGTLGPDDSFSLDLAPLPRSKKPGEIRIVLLCVSGQHLNAGAVGQLRRRYTVDSDQRIVVESPAAEPAPKAAS